MGSDISGAIEGRAPWDEHWWYVVAAGDLGLPRNYGLFAAMANVRQYEERGIVEPVALPRGLPGDASRQVRERLGEDVNQFTTSWLTTEELAEASRRAVAHTGASRVIPDPRSGAEPLIAFMRALEEAGHTVRFVFWID